MQQRQAHLPIGMRSRISLCQLLSYVCPDEVNNIVTKHGLGDIRLANRGIVNENLNDGIREASLWQVSEIIQELARTFAAVRAHAVKKSAFDQRWADLKLCLLLDGICHREGPNGEPGMFAPIEPNIQGVQPIEDDLTRELKRSELDEVPVILTDVEESANAFRAGNNRDCLTAARVAMETLAKSIAVREGFVPPPNTDKKLWGKSIDHLERKGFLKVADREGLTGVYSFISRGLHIPLGLSDLEFARLGRTLAFSCCYFLAKAANAKMDDSSP